MAIVVNKRPYLRNWSGNPIHYTLYSDTAEADSSLYFEFRIQFKRTDEADYAVLITLPFKPVTGTAKIDIQDLLDGMLEYELPVPAENEISSLFMAKKATGTFYIEYRELDPASDDVVPWIEDESANELLVIKGGISFEKWRGDNYWVNYFDTLKPFLTWAKKSAMHSISERMYLSWFNNTEISVTEIMMRRTLRFTDGSEDVAYLDCAVPQNNIVHFPSGGVQLGLEDVDTTKTIHWWELQVYHVNPNPEEPLSEGFRYYLDNRNDYNAVTLNFRNSLGGTDSARIRGVLDYTLNREFTQIEKVVLHDYFSGHFITGKIGSDNSNELLVYKGEIGHLPKEEQDRMRDMHFNRECWWEQEYKFLPVMILTGSNRQKLSTDKLFSMPVEFAVASGGEYYYTPASINLNEASEVTSSPCTAEIENLAYNYIPGTGWVVTWDDVAPADPPKYLISTPGVNGGLPVEVVVEEYTYVWLPVGDNVITVRPLCLIGGVYYAGALQQITITVEAACVPVTISGTTPSILPAALVDVLYNYDIMLSGTAPFAINTVVKPAWMTIAVVGSTINFSGTPTLGDVGTDLPVSFNITNCTGANTLAFAAVITVLEEIIIFLGIFTITNLSSGDNFIQQVLPNSPTFYTFTSGSLPVLAGQQALGYLISAIATPITVRIIIATPWHKLQLIKNSVIVEEFTNLSSGDFTFGAVPFLTTDNMEIKLIEI